MTSARAARVRWSWRRGTPGDATDAEVDGGVMHQVTLGANWYLNPNSRVTLNGLFGELDREGVDGAFRALLLRFEVDFDPRAAHPEPRVVLLRHSGPNLLQLLR